MNRLPIGNQGSLRVFAPFELFWALIGLILTIAATWMEVFITNAPWDWGGTGLQVYSVGVSFQVGAVLLTGCLGGKNAAALAQIAYLTLGLLLFQVFELQVFTQGGGLAYVREPSFGYLVGFIPAAWICGYLAFRDAPKLETLALSSVSGLAAIHGCGLVYLCLAYGFSWLGHPSLSFLQAVATYSLWPLPGQLVVACAVAVIAFIARRLLFY